jgi:hypothetical protein
MKSETKDNPLTAMSEAKTVQAVKRPQFSFV